MNFVPGMTPEQMRQLAQMQYGATGQPKPQATVGNHVSPANQAQATSPTVRDLGPALDFVRRGLEAAAIQKPQATSQPAQAPATGFAAGNLGAMLPGQAPPLPMPDRVQNPLIRPIDQKADMANFEKGLQDWMDRHRSRAMVMAQADAGARMDPNSFSPAQVEKDLFGQYLTGRQSGTQAADAATRRGQAQMQEYEQKVTGPQKAQAEEDRFRRELESKLQLEKLRAENARDVAEISKESMMRAPLVTAEAKLATEPGNLTPEQMAAGRERLLALDNYLTAGKREANRAERGQGQAQGQATQGEGDQATGSLTSRDEEVRRGEQKRLLADQQARLGRQLGYLPAEQGQEPGSFSVDRLLSGLSQTPELLSDPYGRSLLSGMLKKGTGKMTAAEVQAELERALIGRTNDNFLGFSPWTKEAGGLEVAYDPVEKGVPFSQRFSIRVPGGGELSSYRAPVIPMGQVGAGLGSFIPPITATAKTRAAEEAKVMGTLLRTLYGLY